MSGFLRFVRIVNAAVWCGGAVFLVVGLPAVFSAQLEALLSKAYVGFVAEAMVHRYFIFYYCCAGVALFCLGGEWMYAGRGSKLDAWLVSCLSLAGLAFGALLEPRMQVWHYVKYFGRTPGQRESAAHLFGMWHGISQLMNLVIIVGLVWYLWRMTRPSEWPHYRNVTKIRG